MSNVAAAAGVPPTAAAQRAAMDAADAARREDRDAGRVRRDHRRRDGRRRPAAVGECRRETRPGGLPDRSRRCRGQGGERGLVQADEQPPAADRDRRGDGPGRANRRLGRGRDLEVLRVRQAVADERRFERDHGPALGQGRGHLGLSNRRAGRYASVSVGVRPRRLSRAAVPVRGEVSWRAAVRCPTIAARWSEAASGPPGRARREPADEEPGVERVAGAGRIGHRQLRGRDLEPRPLPGPRRVSTVAPFGPRLTTAVAATSSSPSTPCPPRNASASEAVANSRSGATVRDELAGRAPAVGEQRPDRREVDAHRSLRRHGQGPPHDGPASPSGSPSSE